MRKTDSESFDVSVLENRIAVSDKELACMLGVGLTAARRIAQEANAVFRIGKTKRNSVPRIKTYIDNTVVGE